MLWSAVMCEILPLRLCCSDQGSTAPQWTVSASHYLPRQQEIPSVKVKQEASESGPWGGVPKYCLPDHRAKGTSERRGQNLSELLLEPAFLPATEQHNVCEAKPEGQGFEHALVDSRQRFLGKMVYKCERGQCRDLASLKVGSMSWS